MAVKTNRKIQSASHGEPKKFMGVALPKALAEKFEQEAAERKISVSWVLAEKLQQAA